MASAFFIEAKDENQQLQYLYETQDGVGYFQRIVTAPANKDCERDFPRTSCTFPMCTETSSTVFLAQPWHQPYFLMEDAHLVLVLKPGADVADVDPSQIFVTATDYSPPQPFVSLGMAQALYDFIDEVHGPPSDGLYVRPSLLGLELSEPETDPGTEPRTEPGTEPRTQLRFRFPLRLLLGEIALSPRIGYSNLCVMAVVPPSLAANIAGMALCCEGSHAVHSPELDDHWLKTPYVAPNSVICDTDNWGVAHAPLIPFALFMICIDASDVLSVEVEGEDLPIHLYSRGSYTFGTFGLGMSATGPVMDIPDIPSWSSLYTARKVHRFELGKDLHWKITTCSPNRRLVVTCFTYNLLTIRGGVAGSALSRNGSYPMSLSASKHTLSKSDFDDVGIVDAPPLTCPSTSMPVIQ